MGVKPAGVGTVYVDVDVMVIVVTDVRVVVVKTVVDFVVGTI